MVQKDSNIFHWESQRQGFGSLALIVLYQNKPHTYYISALGVMICQSPRYESQDMSLGSYMKIDLSIF